jgi:hypothetical protein
MRTFTIHTQKPIKKPMTKQNEIEILRACAEKLGPDSYCGPWLANQIPAIESDIRADLFPMRSYGDARQMQAEEQERTKQACADAIKRAEKEAAQIVEKAQKSADSIRFALRRELQAALDRI